MIAIPKECIKAFRYFMGKYLYLAIISIHPDHMILDSKCAILMK